MFGRLSTRCPTLIRIKNGSSQLSGFCNSRSEKWIGTQDNEECDSSHTISGTWRNKLNSTMTLAQKGDFLEGSYTTAIEYQNGSAGGPDRPLYGNVGKKFLSSGQLASWTVIWNNGASATTWNGHRYNCSETGQEVISTTWICRDMIKSNENSYTPTRIGQDVFYRVE